MDTKKYLLYLLLLITSILISACVSSQPKLYAQIRSGRHLNPDVNGRASPVVISIYQLKSPYNFRNASYETLNNGTTALGLDLIDKQTFEIRPGIQKNISLSLDNNSKYLGVVAGFRVIDAARWHSVIHLPQRNKNISIKINLGKKSISAYLLKK